MRFLGCCAQSWTTSITKGIEILAWMCCWFVTMPTAARAIAAVECAVAGAPAAAPGTEATASGDQIATTNDLSIIDSMLQQRARAMALANEALQNAQDSQVRRLALRIAEGHAGEMQLLRFWRSSWFPDAPDVISPLAEPSNLGSPEPNCSGEEFDRPFLVLLRAELHAEVAEARSAVANAIHVELQDFATSLIDIRAGEIGMIDTLLAAR